MQELHLKPGLLLLQSDHLTPLLVDSPRVLFVHNHSIEGAAPEHNGAIKMLLTMSLQDFFFLPLSTSELRNNALRVQRIC